MGDTVPTQVAVQHPKGSGFGLERSADLLRKAERVLGDQGRPVGAVLIVDGDGSDFTSSKSVDEGVDRPTQIQAHVMVAYAAEEFGGVHPRTVFVVAAHRIDVGRLPVSGTGF